MPSARKTVDLVGDIAKVTRHAVLWHCTAPQIEAAADAVIGHSLWFPQRWVRRGVTPDGRTILTVPAAALAERIAALPKKRAVPPWWAEKEEAIA